MGMSLMTRWEDWRRLMGPAGGRQRRAIEDQLRTRPALLYWGDSWFSTPLYLNLARQSAAGIDGIGMLIGRPGATAAQLFSAGEVHRVVARVRGNPFDLLCLSAGGNDALGTRLERAFAPGQGGGRPRLTAAQAFDELARLRFFAPIEAAYRGLLDALAGVHQARPAFRVVGHGYAPLRRIGVPGDLTTTNIGLVALLKDDVGPWLWRPMQAVVGNKTQARAFAALMLEAGFRDGVLASLARDYPFFRHADFTTVPAMHDDAAWYDEIHPTEAGFAALAAEYNAELRRALPVAKRAGIA